MEEFKKLMEIMDLNRDDMATVFRVLDADSTEEVPYLEFCQHLGSFFKRDPVIMQSLVRYSVLEVRKLLERDVMAMLQQQTLMLQRLLQDAILYPISIYYIREEHTLRDLDIHFIYAQIGR